MFNSQISSFDLNQIEDESVFSSSIQPGGGIIAVFPPSSFFNKLIPPNSSNSDISDLNSFIITHVSENIDTVLGTKEISGANEMYIGQPLIKIINEYDVRSILIAPISSRSTYFHYPISITSIKQLTSFTHITHSGHLLIDLLPQCIGSFIPTELPAVGMKYLETCENMYKDVQRASDDVNKILNYDRLLIYRNLPFNQGEIIAESQSAHAPEDFSYLGKRFSNSAIKLSRLQDYAARGIRMVVDSFAKNVKVIGALEAGIRDLHILQVSPSLDLSQSFLYPVSQKYITYLRHLQIRSVLISPIVRQSNDATFADFSQHSEPTGISPDRASSSQSSSTGTRQLWGLIVCYQHTESLHLSWSVRDLMMQVTNSIAIGTMYEEQQSLSKQNIQLKSMTIRLETILKNKNTSQTDPSDDSGILHQIVGGHPDLCEKIGCSSFAVCCQDSWLRLGACPSLEWLQEFTKFIVERHQASNDGSPDVTGNAEKVQILSSRDLDLKSEMQDLLHSLDSRACEYMCAVAAVTPSVIIFCFQHSYLDRQQDLAHPQQELASYTSINTQVPSPTFHVYDHESESPHDTSPSHLNKTEFSESNPLVMNQKWPANAVPMMQVVIRHLKARIDYNHGDIQFLLDELHALRTKMVHNDIHLSSSLLREYMDGILVVSRRSTYPPTVTSKPDERHMDKILCVNQGYTSVFGFPGETADCDDGDIEETLMNAGVSVEGLIDAHHNTTRMVHVWSKEKGRRCLQMYYRHVLNIYQNQEHQEILCMSFYDITRFEQMRMALEASRLKAIRLGLAKQQIIGMVSHELRTPLHAILGFSNLLQTEWGQQFQGSMQEYLQNIQDAGGHLLSIITNLLDLTKAEQIQMSIVDVRTVLKQACSWIQPNINSKFQKSTIHIPSDIPMFVLADPVSLKRIFVNLLDNAVKFTPDSGVINIDCVTLPATYASPFGFVRVQIQDTGIGMKLEELPKIFDMFYQVDLSSQREVGGAGLGLAMVKKLVDKFDGTIHVESGLGKGTTFTVTLPLSKRPINDVIPTNGGRNSSFPSSSSGDISGDISVPSFSPTIQVNTSSSPSVVEASPRFSMDQISPLKDQTQQFSCLNILPRIGKLGSVTPIPEESVSDESHHSSSSISISSHCKGSTFSNSSDVRLYCENEGLTNKTMC